MSDKVMKTKRAKQANKSSKPLLERQRRARINNSLNELKTLVLSSLYQGCPQAEKNSEKMEKAEILELTVNFLKLARSRRTNGFRPAENKVDPRVKYTTAMSYKDCFTRVNSLNENVQQRCSDHIFVPHLTSMTPCSASGQVSPSGLEGNQFCRGVRPAYVGYEIGAPSLSPVSQLSPSSLSRVMVNSVNHQQEMVPNAGHFSLHHGPSSKVQVWRPW